jgi:hypothetical protein
MRNIVLLNVTAATHGEQFKSTAAVWRRLGGTEHE